MESQGGGCQWTVLRLQQPARKRRPYRKCRRVGGLAWEPRARSNESTETINSPARTLWKSVGTPPPPVGEYVDNESICPFRKTTVDIGTVRIPPRCSLAFVQRTLYNSKREHRVLFKPQQGLRSRHVEFYVITARNLSSSTSRGILTKFSFESDINRSGNCGEITSGSKETRIM